MATIICKQCGYENPEGSTVCEICAEPLTSEEVVDTIPPTMVQETIKPADVQATVHQIEEDVDDGNEYFVLCPESQTKTIIPNGKVSRFYCEGCKKEHDIDGFLWVIESKKREDSQENTATVSPATAQKATGDKLVLEEINSHFRIEIDKTGGTIGRYGKYGAEFFQSRNLLMVSGEHCLITNEYGNWVIRHKSKTNQTKYNNMILGADEPNLMEDGKILTLANAVSFVVRIE